MLPTLASAPTPSGTDGQPLPAPKPGLALGEATPALVLPSQGLPCQGWEGNGLAALARPTAPGFSAEEETSLHTLKGRGNKGEVSVLVH